MDKNNESSPRSGTTYRLGKVIASGGEGKIHECLSHPHLVIKVFTGDTNEIGRKEVRVREMHSLQGLKNHPNIAWPQVVLSQDGKFLGYAMRKMADTVTLVPLSAEASRKRYLPGWRQVHKAYVAYQIAKICRELAQVSTFVVDTSLTNFLTNPRTAEIYLIDTDSLQFTSKNGSFGSSVFTPDFAAPEVLRNPERLHHIGPEQARFTMAMLLFQIFTQSSPFQVLDRGTLDPAQQIIFGRTFIGGAGVATGFTTSEIFSRYRRLPAPLVALFVETFHAGHKDPKARPSFAQWEHVTLDYYRTLHSAEFGSRG